MPARKRPAPRSTQRSTRAKPAAGKRVAGGSAAATPRAGAAKQQSTGTPAVARPNAEVVEFLRRLDHPLKPALEAVREAILDADPGINEGIKWNAPSFHFTDYFATANLRRKDTFVRVVFHRGATARDNTTEGLKVDDPAGLLDWHAKDRCSACFRSLEDLRAKRATLQTIVRQWIAWM
ncbi:MAG: DUF1801 domain-containing protein [Planctomycetes bacterium]|nr:DUF1801 domain-containing protein [Planctomycetota bacterium]